MSCLRTQQVILIQWETRTTTSACALGDKGLKNCKGFGFIFPHLCLHQRDSVASQAGLIYFPIFINKNPFPFLVFSAALQSNSHPATLLNATLGSSRVYVFKHFLLVALPLLSLYSKRANCSSQVVSELADFYTA